MPSHKGLRLAYSREDRWEPPPPLVCHLLTPVNYRLFVAGITKSKLEVHHPWGLVVRPGHVPQSLQHAPLLYQRLAGRRGPQRGAERT